MHAGVESGGSCLTLSNPKRYFRWRQGCSSERIALRRQRAVHALALDARAARKQTHFIEEISDDHEKQVARNQLRQILHYAESGACRRRELLAMAARCERVPAQGAETLHDALQSLWIAWIGLHMESTNAGLSLGDFLRLESRARAADTSPAAADEVVAVLRLYGDLPPAAAD